LKSCCRHLEVSPKKGEQFDIDGNVKLKLLHELLSKEKMGANSILNFLKRMNCFSNANIALRILLTIHVVVASAERSFFKLKFFNSTWNQPCARNIEWIRFDGDWKWTSRKSWSWKFGVDFCYFDFFF